MLVYAGRRQQLLLAHYAEHIDAVALQERHDRLLNVIKLAAAAPR